MKTRTHLLACGGKKSNRSRNKRFSYGFAPILHARSCIHFLWFPHAHRAPRPLKRPQNKIIWGAFFPKTFFITFGSPWGYGSMVPPWGHVVDPGTVVWKLATQSSPRLAWHITAASFWLACNACIKFSSSSI